MATSKTRGIYRTTKRVNPKTGKTVKSKVKIGEKVTNTAKRSNMGLTGNAAKLKALKITEDAGIQKAKVAGRTSTLSEAIAGATSTALKALDRGRTQSSEIRQIKSSNQDAGVAQSINGGVTAAAGSRNDDEDEEDNPMIA